MNRICRVASSSVYQSRSLAFSSLVQPSAGPCSSAASSATLKLLERDRKFVLNTYDRRPLVLDTGNGIYVRDVEGKQYIDFGSGIAVSSLGHQHPALMKAIQEGSKNLWHSSNLFASSSQVDLADRLVSSSSFDKAFFCNSGTEANEAALKFAKKIGLMQHKDKTKIVAFTGGFHGRTAGSLSVTYKPSLREPFGPLLPNVVFAEFNNVNDAVSAIDADTCAVIVEPIQGEAGVYPATEDFLRAVSEAASASSAVLIFDEIQVGLGRTGRLWCHEALNLQPDIVTLAKPLAGGLPVGAVLVKEQIASAIASGDHGTTFGGNCLVTAVASANFDVVSESGFLQNVRDVGDFLFSEMQKLSRVHSSILDVRSGGGLLIGIELSSNEAVNAVVSRSAELGLLLITAGANTIRLAPPLILNRSQASEALSILQQAIEDTAASSHR